MVLLPVYRSYHGPLDRFWRRKVVGILTHPHHRIIVVNVLKKSILTVKIAHLNHIVNQQEGGDHWTASERALLLSYPVQLLKRCGYQVVLVKKCQQSRVRFIGTSVSGTTRINSFSANRPITKTS